MAEKMSSRWNAAGVGRYLERAIREARPELKLVGKERRTTKTEDYGYDHIQYVEEFSYSVYERLGWLRKRKLLEVDEGEPKRHVKVHDPSLMEIVQNALEGSSWAKVIC